MAHFLMIVEARTQVEDVKLSSTVPPLELATRKRKIEMGGES